MDIVMLLFDRITALDGIGPYEVLKSLPDARMRFVGIEARTVRTDHGLGLVADQTIDEVRSADVLVIPGGLGTRALVHDERLLDWIREVHQTTTWTTSVCTGSLLLGAAGLLRGIPATTHWSSLETLAGYGAVPSAARVVRHGKIVTAAGVSAGIDMALHLAAWIAGEDTARMIQLGIEYDPQPPFDSGSVAKAPELRDRLLELWRARDMGAPPPRRLV